MSKPSLIPIPLDQRWRDARIRLIPAFVFGFALIAVAILWKDYVAAPTMVGQVEPIQVNVTSYKPGMLSQVNVKRFQTVKAGEPVGQILGNDPKVLASSLALVQSEIEMLRISLKPAALQQGTASNYDHLLDWMRERAQLAMARVNLQYSGAEFHQMEELARDKIVSQWVLEQAKSAQDRMQNEVDALIKVVKEEEGLAKPVRSVENLEVSHLLEDPLRAAIAVQESKLRLTEAELGPLTLRAPVDGMVSRVFHHSGEAIAAGDPILTIDASNSVRIVGYLRPPILNEPVVGMTVDVRTRGPRREMGSAKIIEVGTQMETITPPLVPSGKLASAELGLPVGISLPENLKTIPGELVDVTWGRNKQPISQQ